MPYGFYQPQKSLWNFVRPAQEEHIAWPVLEHTCQLQLKNSAGTRDHRCHGIGNCYMTSEAGLQKCSFCFCRFAKVSDILDCQICLPGLSCRGKEPSQSHRKFVTVDLFCINVQRRFPQAKHPWHWTPRNCGRTALCSG